MLDVLMRKVLSVLLSGLVFFASASLAGEIGSLTGVVQMTSKKANFKWDDSKQAYLATETEMELSGTINGTGVFRQRNNQINVVQNSVPGRTVGGHSHLWLIEKASGEFVVKEDTQYIDSREGLNYSSQQSTDVDVVSGSKQELLRSGQALVLSPTAQSRDQILKTIVQDFVNSVVVSLREELRRSGQRVIVSSQIISTQLSPNYRYVFSGDTASILGFDLRYQVKVTAFTE